MSPFSFSVPLLTLLDGLTGGGFVFSVLLDYAIVIITFVQSFFTAFTLWVHATDINTITILGYLDRVNCKDDYEYKKEEPMKHIAILSDTHGLLREQVIAELTGSNYTIHAGDINTPEILVSLQKHGEAYVVRGNNDKDWAQAMPRSLAVTIEGVRFLIVHNKKDIPKNLTDVDVVVYGHSHKYAAQIVDEVLFLNPGSCGKRRFNLELTMCHMTVDDGHYQYKKVMIPHDAH